MPLSYYGDSHNCLYGLILKSHEGIAGVLRQCPEKGNSHDGTERLPKPFLVSSVLFATAELMEESGPVRTSLYTARDAQT